MKVFIIYLLFVSALVCVNCDSESEQKDWINKTITEYMKLSEDQINDRIHNNSDAIQAMIKEATDQHSKDGLDVVAQFLTEISQFLNTGRNALEELKKVDEKYRKENLIELGFALESIKTTAGMERNRRKNKPLKVTDTEENYNKKLKNIIEEILTNYKKIIANEMNDKSIEKAFMNRFHQKEYEFVNKMLKNVEINVKNLKSSEMRVKNMVELIADLNLLLNMITNKYK